MNTALSAVLGVLGVLATGGLIGAILTHRRESAAALIAALSARVSEVEADLRDQHKWRRVQEARYTQLYAYARALLDYAYKHRREESPELPPMPPDLE